MMRSECREWRENGERKWWDSEPASGKASLCRRVPFDTSTLSICSGGAHCCAEKEHSCSRCCSCSYSDAMLDSEAMPKRCLNKPLKLLELRFLLRRLKSDLKHSRLDAVIIRRWKWLCLHNKPRTVCELCVCPTSAPKGFWWIFVLIILFFYDFRWFWFNHFDYFFDHFVLTIWFWL